MELARKAAGGKNIDIARLLGITDAAVAQWGEIIPPKRAIELEQKTGGAVTRYQLRPDHFGHPSTRDERAA